VNSDQPSPDNPSHDNRSLIRVSDAEREAVVSRLNEATSEGLTLEEFSGRVSAALEARTRGDLDALVVDLPTGRSLASPAIPGGALAARSQIVPIGAVKRFGRWRLDRDSQLGTVVGSVKLDMRQAEDIPAPGAPLLRLRIDTVVGSVKVYRR
jgi:hypothetical protein